MQSFVPYPDLRRTTRVLDPKRLPNQLLESEIILKAITVGNGWSKHAACKMWEGYAGYYLHYIDAFQAEYGRRRNRYHGSYLNAMRFATSIGLEHDGRRPPWWGSDRVHASHRAMLLRKDEAWYGPKFADERERLEKIEGYVWPV